MMKQYVMEPGADAIRLVDATETEVGVKDVKVELKAASLNYRDILMRKRAPEAIVPFSDGAGVVVEVGAEVEDFKVGDRVLGLFFPNWIDGEITREIHGVARGGGDVDGMLSEFVVGHEQSFVAVPEHLDFEEASTLPCAGLTAWHALFEHARPAKKGDTILIQGTGGVSIFALQLAVAFGLKTIVLSSSSEKLERVQEIGATHTINYLETPDWDKEVWRITEKRGVDLVVEVGGAGTLERSMKAVKYHGVISLIGVLTGTQAEVNPFPVVGKSLQVFGIYVGSKEMHHRFHAALEKHAIKPVVDKVFAFEAAEEAYTHQKSGKHFGNVVVRGL
ncbi:NAD(P)-dependent alcohol dehydrogenase [Rubritalea spongiae]|uniref:NAD(P)-dependent alcohol dehydrogenase n=1 Tax=Rubritalea spongiae TaxID=430797 RepID=A0ABW5E4B2_9BACT